MRIRSALIATVVAMTVAAPTATAVAEEQGFKASAVMWIVSSEVVGEQATIEVEGQGQSKLLGSFSVTASLDQILVPGCDPGSGTFTFSTEAGTLELHAEALVCFTEVTGVWQVTGGSGAYSEASGGGSFTGSPSHSGEDPIVVHFEGVLSL
jgi:hypothetical protein